ncbi:hypothetical protein G9P44_000987 [Scheffersomyces stipitis]|nr:hypothetical protein G9P44_000987 [Scheffersomyces stipitis]
MFKFPFKWEPVEMVEASSERSDGGIAEETQSQNQTHSSDNQSVFQKVLNLPIRNVKSQLSGIGPSRVTTSSEGFTVHGEEYKEFLFHMLTQDTEFQKEVHALSKRYHTLLSTRDMLDSFKQKLDSYENHLNEYEHSLETQQDFLAAKTRALNQYQTSMELKQEFLDRLLLYQENLMMQTGAMEYEVSSSESTSFEWQ